MQDGLHEGWSNYDLGIRIRNTDDSMPVVWTQTHEDQFILALKTLFGAKPLSAPFCQPFCPGLNKLMKNTQHMSWRTLIT